MSHFIKNIKYLPVYSNGTLIGYLPKIFKIAGIYYDIRDFYKKTIAQIKVEKLKDMFIIETSKKILGAYFEGFIAKDDFNRALICKIHKLLLGDYKPETLIKYLEYDYE